MKSVETYCFRLVNDTFRPQKQYVLCLTKNYEDGLLFYCGLTYLESAFYTIKKVNAVHLLRRDRGVSKSYSNLYL